MYIMYCICLISLLGKRFHSEEDCQDLQLECLSKLERWTDIVRRLTLVLTKSPDNWRNLKLYVKGQMQLCADQRRKAINGEIAKEKEVVVEKEG